MLARAIVVVMALVAAVALEIFRRSTEPFFPLIFGAITAGTAIAGLTGVDKKVQGAVSGVVDKKSTCQFQKRELVNGEWKCAPGWRDTGKQWGQPEGDKQCEVCNTAPVDGCEYGTRQQQSNGEYWCPSGWRDTGNHWSLGNHGDKQCAKCNSVPLPGCQYQIRQLVNGVWQCPAGWGDTRNNWEWGANGDKQCEKC